MGGGALFQMEIDESCKLIINNHFQGSILTFRDKLPRQALYSKITVH